MTHHGIVVPSTAVLSTTTPSAAVPTLLAGTSMAFEGSSSTLMTIRHHPDPPPLLPSSSESFFLLASVWLTDNFVTIQQMLSWLLNGPLTLLFVLSGIALNALCVLVFLRFRNTGGTTPIIHYYLISLACWHSALLCNAFVLYCLPTLLWGSIVSSGPYVHLYPPTYTLANATHTGTVWIILALTLDRYLALCMPFKHRMFSKRSRVKRLVVGLSVLAIVFSLPRFFEVATVFECTPSAALGNIINDNINVTDDNGELEVTATTMTTTMMADDDGQHDCLAYVQRTGLPQNQLYRTLYHILLGSTFVTILPGILTFVLTLRITIALSEAQRSRKRLSHCEPMRSSGENKTTTTTITTSAEKESHSGGRDMDNPSSAGSYNIAAPVPISNGGEKHRAMLLGAACNATAKKASCLRKKEHRANVMLVVVIVKFLISDILPTVLDVFETFIGNEAFMSSPVATLWVDFSNLLLVLNCSTNFWVFIFYVRGFRHRCARLLAISLRLSPAPMPVTIDGNESAFCGSYLASPRLSTPQCLLNGTTTAYNNININNNRPRGSTGGIGFGACNGRDYTDLAKNAMLNSCTAVPPILRDALNRPNGNGHPNNCSSFGSFSGPVSRQQSPHSSRGASPPGSQGSPTADEPPPAPMGNGNNGGYPQRSKRAGSLGVTQQQRIPIVGVTITPPPPPVPQSASSMMANGGGMHQHSVPFRQNGLCRQQ